MAVEVFSNNTRGYLSGAISAADTVIPVTNAAQYPALTGGNYCRAVITSSSNPGLAYEYLIVTAVDTINNLLTVTRGQENVNGTAPARAWAVGDIIYQDDTAASWQTVQSVVGVNSFNGRTGAVTLLSSDVTTALGYVPALPIPVTNDSTTAITLYPTFAAQTGGNLTAISVSSSELTFVPSTGNLASKTVEANQGFFLNPTALTTNYTVPVGYNAMTAGPFSTGAFTVTTPPGSAWTVV